jgi:hypothetical protein
MKGIWLMSQNKEMLIYATSFQLVRGLFDNMQLKVNNLLIVGDFSRNPQLAYVTLDAIMDHIKNNEENDIYQIMADRKHTIPFMPSI